MTHIMWLTNLAPDIQEAILFLPRVESGPDTVKEIDVRRIARVMDWEVQWGLGRYDLSKFSYSDWCNSMGEVTYQKNQYDTKASGKVITNQSKVPVADRRSITRGGTAPIAASEHAGQARCGTNGVGHSLNWNIASSSLTPLPDIVVRIAKAPIIWHFCAHGLRLIARVLSQPCIVT